MFPIFKKISLIIHTWADNLGQTRIIKLLRSEKMSLLKEYKEFATKGNVVDLAVGVIIGGAFGKIVSSLVADIIMPPIGVIVGGVRFTDIKLKLKDPVIDASGKVIQEAVTMNIGSFIQTTFDFLIIAGAIFLLVKLMNSLHRKQRKEEAPAPAVPTAEIELLQEIRDLLQKSLKFDKER